MERTKEQRVKIITNSGYRYTGALVEKNSLFVVINDDVEGRIEVPLANISMLKEVKEE